MAGKYYGEKHFDLGDGWTATCITQDTRYGFRHLATVYQDGSVAARAKACYYNRTWESYTYQTVLHEAIRKVARYFTDVEAVLKHVDAVAEGRIKKEFGFLGALMALGDLLTEDSGQRVDWKTRMLQAGLPGIEPPDDWDRLPVEDQECRLNRVIAELRR